MATPSSLRWRRNLTRRYGPRTSRPPANEALPAHQRGQARPCRHQALHSREAGPRVAKSTLTKIKDVLVFLGGTPGAGHIREDLTAEPVRFWPVFSYLIVYDPAPRPIEILRIIHGRREISAILAQDDD